MHVTEIWRHPVKSLQGESLGETTVELGGLAGDRRWGVRDLATGKILTGRREPQLLAAAAALDADGTPTISLPDGSTVHGCGTETDAALSEWLGKAVSLDDALTSEPATAEFFADATDDSSEAITWTMPEGRFVDATPLLLLTTASVRAGQTLYPEGQWDNRRFRPNIVIDTDEDGWVEDGWYHRPVTIGDAVVVPREPCVRCTMVTRPQPGLERDLEVYKTLARHHAGTFGAWTAVEAPGTVRVGDEVRVG